MNRILRMPDGNEVKNAKKIDAFLSDLRNQPHKDVRAYLRGVHVTPEALHPYKRRLLATIVVPEVVIEGAEFTNPIYEHPDIEIKMDNDCEADLRLPWRCYYFTVDTPSGQILCEVQMTITHGDWISKPEDWLPMVELLADGKKAKADPTEKQRLEKRRKELYAQLKEVVAQRLNALQDS